MEQMNLAGAREFISYYRRANGTFRPILEMDHVDLSIAYLVTGLPYGVPLRWTALSLLEGKRVLFGFPDILIQTEDVYVRLLDRMHVSQADIVLGLFLADNPIKTDMVELAADDTIRHPDQTRPNGAEMDLDHSGVEFEFHPIHAQLRSPFLQTIATPKAGPTDHAHKEVHLGDVVQAAIEAELKIDTVKFPKGAYIDIGTPEDLVAAVQAHALGRKQKTIHQ